jgi:hypothetical protein
MDLKLNIYEKREIVKTYVADTYDLMFGTVEDLIDLINLDNLKTGSDTEIIRLVGDLVIKGMDIAKPLLKDIFEGLTDEELKNTKVRELSTVLIEVAKYSLSELMQQSNSKN